MSMEGWIVATIIVIAGALAAVLACDLEVKIRVRRERQNDHIELHFRWLYGLVRRSIELSELRLKGREGLAVKEKQLNERTLSVVDEKQIKIDRDMMMKGYEKYMALLRHILGLSRWLKETLGKVRCYELIWDTQIGAGDAVETATLTGLAWSLKGSMVGYVSKHIRFRILPKLDITPLYNEQMFATRLSSILKLRTGYALLAAILLLVRLLRARGRGKASKRALIGQAAIHIFILLMTRTFII